MGAERLADGNGVWVLGLIQGSAADQAGLQQGDQLLELDGQPLGGRSPFEVASLLQGVEGGADGGGGAAEAPPQPPPPVALKFRKFSDGSLASAVLPRPATALPSPVTARLEPARGGAPATGVIRLSSFNARAQRDVAAAVRGLEARGAARLVLDLRDNRGGLVSEGIEVARLFLDGEEGRVGFRTAAG